MSVAMLSHSPGSHPFPYCGHPRSNARLWYGMSGTRVLARLGLGVWALWLQELRQSCCCQRSGVSLWHSSCWTCLPQIQHEAVVWSGQGWSTCWLGYGLWPASFSVSCGTAKVSANNGSRYPIEWGLRHAGSWHHLCEH